MSAPEIPQLEDGNFATQIKVDGSSLRVAMTGTANLSIQKNLKAFLADLHACALGNMTTQVLIDWRSLDFMNSSCLREMVAWIFSVRRETAGRQYKIVFLANPSAQWQHRSLQALSCMATQLVTVRH